MDTAKELGAIISSVGFPSALILLMVFGGWKAMYWVGENVLRPLTARGLEFLNELSEGFRAIKINQDEQTRTLLASACRYQTCSRDGCEQRIPIK